MSRLRLFHFSWHDVWFSSRVGYDTILESTADGGLYLKYIVDMKPYSIELTDKEDEFIKCIEKCGLINLNGNKYYECCEDGYMWHIDIAYDDKVIRTCGDNAYPPEFWDFLEMKIKNWHMKKSVLVESIKAERMKYHKECIVESMNDNELTWPSYIT